LKAIGTVPGASPCSRITRGDLDLLDDADRQRRPRDGNRLDRVGEGSRDGTARAGNERLYGDLDPVRVAVNGGHIDGEPARLRSPAATRSTMLRPKSTAAASDGAPGMRSRASRQGTLSVITSRSTEVKSLYCWSSSTTGSMVELSTRNASTGSEPDGAHAASGAARQRIRAAWPTMLAGPRLTTTPRRDSRRMSHRPPESGPLVVEGEERSLVIGNRSRNSPRPTRCTVARRA